MPGDPGTCATKKGKSVMEYGRRGSFSVVLWYCGIFLWYRGIVCNCYSSYAGIVRFTVPIYENTTSQSVRQCCTPLLPTVYRTVPPLNLSPRTQGSRSMTKIPILPKITLPLPPPNWPPTASHICFSSLSFSPHPLIHPPPLGPYSAPHPQPLRHLHRRTRRLPRVTYHLASSLIPHPPPATIKPPSFPPPPCSRQGSHISSTPLSPACSVILRTHIALQPP